MAENKKETKVIILKEHNGDYQGWNEITEEELKIWLNDGSIQEGDRIVYPRLIQKIISKTTIIREVEND